MSTETATIETNPLDAVHATGRTDIGLRREENQDSFGVIETPNFRIYVVADGMGGVKGGLIASSLAVEIIRDNLKDRQSIDEAALTEAIAKANAAIFEKGSSEPGLMGMGTTVVLLAFVGSRLLIASVGDSRAYRLRGGLLEQLTEDHTLVNELLRAGTITEEQAGTHPVSHMLTRSLGPAHTVEIDCFQSKELPEAGDFYLLCSDGLYNMVHPEEFVEVIQSLPGDEVPSELISLANLRGGVDNITVITVQIKKDGADAEPVKTPEPVEIPGREGWEAMVENAAHAGMNGGGAIELDADNAKLQAEQTAAKAAPETQATPEQPAQAASEKAPIADEQADQRPRFLRYGIPLATIAAIATVLYFSQRRIPAPQVQPPQQTTVVTLPAVAAPPSSIVALNQLASSSSTSAISAAAASSQAEAPATTLSSSSASSASLAASLSSQPALSSSSSSQPAASSQSEVIAAQSSAAQSSAARAMAPVVEPLSEEKKAAARKEALQARIQTLQDRLAAFDKPISGKTAEMLGQSLARLTELEKKQTALNATVQESSNKLGRWLGFKRTLEEQNPIDIAGDMADLSPAVKEKQDAFQKATWAYLQEYEKSQQSAPTPDEDRKVLEMAHGRAQAMEALNNTIRSVVVDQIAEADKAVGDATYERDAVAVQIRTLHDDISYARILIGNDASARQQEKKDIVTELAEAQNELKQLSILIPDVGVTAAAPQASSASSSSASRQAPVNAAAPH